MRISDVFEFLGRNRNTCINYEEVKCVTFGIGKKTLISRIKYTKFSYTVLQHTMLSGVKGPFIGANDIVEEGEFQWDHSGLDLSSGFTNWGVEFGLNEPNDYLGEDCVILSAGSSNGVWFDIPCEGPRKVICEMLQAMWDD